MLHVLEGTNEPTRLCATLFSNVATSQLHLTTKQILQLRISPGYGLPLLCALPVFPLPKMFSYRLFLPTASEAQLDHCLSS
jgi:hypothetical protein